MPIHNNDIGDIFNRIADYLEIKGENQFRIRAYRNAARTISSLSRNITAMIDNGEELTDLPGIGKDLSEKIHQIVKTGTLKQLQELEKEVPPGLIKMMQMSTLGPRRVKAIYDELGISTVGELEKSARAGKIQNLEGFGEKTEKKIIEEAARLREQGESKRTPLVVAERIVEPYIDYLKKSKGIKNIEVAGSFRRKKESVGDLDILVSCSKNAKIMERFTSFEDVAEVIASGETKSSVILRRGLQVDLRVVPEVAYGAALVYFTGSKAHNIRLRKMGIQKNLKINEYGVFKDEKRIAGKSEEEVYKKLKLPYIEPELREDSGEIEAAMKGKLPELVKVEDLKGDLQSHTTETDGKFSLEEMADAAQKKGYEYLAVTDHSKRVSVAGGMDEKRLEKQIEEIEKLNKKLKNFRILKSVEVDILEDGTLDLADSILKELDVVVCSIHYNLNLSRDKQTRRVLKAMENPNFNIMAHPTGRLIGRREPYDINLEDVIKEARKQGCYLEVNAQPDRLDLSDSDCRLAKELGVRVAISTDAHSQSDLDLIRYGINQARRGWLEAADVLNTRSWPELKKLLQRH
jgi:DNA polymerase (family 10)